MLPALPQSYQTEQSKALKVKMESEFLLLEQELANEDSSKEEFFKTVRKLYIAINLAMSNLTQGINVENTPNLIKDIDGYINELLQSINNDPCQRESKLSLVIEKASISKLLFHFFQTGKVLSFSSIQPCSDEEYLGALISFSQELSYYSIKRASFNDLQSIELCKAVVLEINQIMLEFDFRNGPLRRKFDGLKYSLKTIEDISFELGLALENNQNENTTEDESPLKKPRLENTSEPEINLTELLNKVEVYEIKGRLDDYDKQRENLIKECRDVQKLSKQAIFAIIRNQLSDALNKLNKSKELAVKLTPVIEKYPTLRAGSYSNSLEEWCEGMLLYQWMTCQTIPSKTELGLNITTLEYIGGLSDFTGEIGRIAVALASKRELDQVKEILQVDQIVNDFISRLNMNNRFGKKLDAVVTNKRKLDHIVYELSIMRKSGRKSTIADFSMEPNQENDKNDDN